MKIFLDANICLDLLDTTRENSQSSIAWYMGIKDDASKELYLSGDFITTIYYILAQKRKLDSNRVVYAIDLLCSEVVPIYLEHSDFISAKNLIIDGTFKDLEDLMVLSSARRAKCNLFVTNDKKLLELETIGDIKLVSPKYL